jgi:hypothetical protein
MDVSLGADFIKPLSQVVHYAPEKLHDENLTHAGNVAIGATDWNAIEFIPCI